MGCILAIDTASPEIGIALSVDGQISEWSGRVRRGAESVLGKALSEMLEKAPPVEGVVVSVGPGSFTSLRVGVSTALGVAFASGCEVLPVCSLRARAVGRPGRVMAILDGRKGRAYASVFVDGQPVSEAVDLPPEDALLLADGEPFSAVGEGAEVWAEKVRAAGGELVENPTASPVSRLVMLFGQSEEELVSPDAVSLRYLRAPDAKLPKDSPARGA